MSWLETEALGNEKSPGLTGNAQFFLQPHELAQARAKGRRRVS